MENLIVFDIDDTLTNSEVQHQTAFVNAMKHYGISKINENWVEYTHITDSFILKENYENNFSKPFSFNLIEQFENAVMDTMLKLKPVSEIEGAKTMIKTVANDSHWGFCFATGSFLKPALLKLDQARIPYYNELVVGSNDLYTREEIVSKAIHRAYEFYNVKRFKHIISIGDGKWDLQTAQNLGVHFIGIGKKNKSNLQSKNTLFHMNNWTDFNFIEKINQVFLTD